ncbi:MAG TPA: TonB-dependent receptor, partial [Nitrospira sp.]|nr:TonB-dependent receptor [Nitrospira sp.]
ILRNRLHFFVNYEGARAYSNAVISGTVPSPYLESISPSVYKSVFALYPSIPQPTSNPTALVGTYHGAATQIQKDGSGLVRLDGNITPTNQIAVRYIRARPNLSVPSLISANPQTYSGHTSAVNANYLHIGSNWTANTRFGLNQIKLTRVNQGINQALQSVAFAGFGGNGMYKGFYQHGNVSTYEEAIALIHGNHSIQVGGIVQRQNASRYIVQTPSFSYSSLSQFQADIPATAELALYAVPPGQPPFGFTNYQYGGYVQDDYHVASTLTLNMGIRYDYFSVPREYAGRFYNSGIDPANPQLGAGFGPFRPKNSLYDADYRGIQPRIGFAWQPKPNTVVHGGFGIFTLGHNFFNGPVSVTRPSPTVPFNVTLTLAQAQQAGIAYPVDPFAYVTQVSQLQQSGVLSSQLPGNTNIDGHNPNPYSIQRFFGIQQALPDGTTFTINYVGSQALQLEFHESKNLPDRVTGILPVPNFPRFSLYTVGDRSNANILQAMIAKQTKKGLYLAASYAWGKVLSYGDADLLLETSPQDVDNMEAEYGPAPFDIRNRFVVQGVWNLPLNHGGFAHSRWARALVEGWKVSGIFTGATGLPQNLRNTGSSYPADRPDVNPGVTQYLTGARIFPGTHQYLNKLAFKAVPISPLSGAQIRGGDLGREAVRLPGTENVDASLTKIFSVSDTVHFQLRAEAFNALNHTNLSGLSTSIASSTFGRLTTATARTMQVSGRITF